MLRHTANRAATTVKTVATKNYDNAKNKAAPFISRIFLPVLMTVCILAAVTIFDNLRTTNSIPAPIIIDPKPIEKPNAKPKAKPNAKPNANTNANANVVQQKEQAAVALASSDTFSNEFEYGALKNSAFANVINRTLHYRQHCHSIANVDDDDGDDDGNDATTATGNDATTANMNNHTAHLPAFGFLDAVQTYLKEGGTDAATSSYPYQCQLPPETECSETQFSVIFMAYNPDRLHKLLKESNTMLTDPEYSKLVREIIVVWNGERHIDETNLGKKLLEMSQTLPLRISYPLQAGFPNDLLNRYHPRLELKTKAILYYDDDGPFYSTRAIRGGFELWKRNSNAQIGAMARKIDLSPRQAKESKGISAHPNDRFFVSHCPSDAVNYNYFSFANFDARMVLPSGSFLHSNYLCFIWHPVFEPIRKYVRSHPVNPDDGTVSMLVSQLAGRAPRVYSRRVPPKENEQGRRRLMDGIDWDSKKGGQKAHDQKMYWGRLRSDVANSLARYFGSLNSGSLGWCFGTPYETTNRKGEHSCKPEMAKVGMLPWMTPDHARGGACPSPL